MRNLLGRAPSPAKAHLSRSMCHRAEGSYVVAGLAQDLRVAYLGLEEGVVALSPEPPADADPVWDRQVAEAALRVHRSAACDVAVCDVLPAHDPALADCTARGDPQMHLRPLGSDVPSSDDLSLGCRVPLGTLPWQQAHRRPECAFDCRSAGCGPHGVLVVSVNEAEPVEQPDIHARVPRAGVVVHNAQQPERRPRAPCERTTVALPLGDERQPAPDLDPSGHCEPDTAGIRGSTSDCVLEVASNGFVAACECSRSAARHPGATRPASCRTVPPFPGAAPTAARSG